MSKRPVFESIPEYLAALEPAQAKALKAVLAVVRETVPACSPVISYGIPAFKAGRVFIYCAAFKKHIGIYPPVRGDARLEKAVAPYANEKGSLRFPLDTPMPLPLIAKVAKALAKAYAQHDKSTAKRKVAKKKVAGKMAQHAAAR